MGNSKFNKKIGIKYIYISLLLICLVNIFTILFMELPAWEVFIPRNYSDQIDLNEQLMDSFDENGIVDFFQYIGPFLVSLILGTSYFGAFFLKRNYICSNTTILRRVVNMPFFGFFFTFIAWITASIFQLLQIFISGVHKGFINVYLFTNGFVPFITGLLIGILTYYALEFLNQKWIIPNYFATGEILKEKRIIKISIQNRFMILLLVTSILPMVFINIIAFNTNSNTIPVLIYSLFFLLISFFVLLFQGRLFKIPIERMDSITSSIELGSYADRAKVLSGDELGRLSNSLNSMSKGLAERDSIKETFGKMVDPAIRDHLLKGNINLGGDFYYATVLFTDIRDFTSISEKLPADKIVGILNRYFAEITEIIIEEGGFINKFLGDAVMALFGVPICNNTHAAQALRAAEKIIKRRDALNLSFKKEGLPQLQTGIGIHTGQLVAGIIGSSARMEYTAIGDTVNVSARLESSCKKLKRDIIFSKETLEGQPDPGRYKKMGNLKVKGREKTITIYSLY